MRRIMIIFASAVAALALATVPADAGAGNLELFSGTGYGGTQVNVSEGALGTACASVEDLTKTFSQARSARNNTTVVVELYKAAGCDGGDFIQSLNPGGLSTWSMPTNGDPATHVLAVP
jgi:hypothetical protein